MSGSIDIFTHTFKARTALAKFSAVEHNTNEDLAVSQHTNPTRYGIGIVQRDVRSGQSAPVLLVGITRFLAGAAVVRGQPLIAAGSGFLSGVASGTAVASTTCIVGRALTSAASGMIGLANVQPQIVAISGTVF